jgi:Surface antigen variable number repeat
MAYILETTILLASLLLCLSGPEVMSKHPTLASVTQSPGHTSLPCSQPIEERDSLLRDAVENQYKVRRVEFIGNERTRDNVLRRRITLQEGDVFTHQNLVRSLENVSKLKRIIYPVKLSDVILSLDRPEKIVDLAICFRERRPHRRVKRSPAKGAS